MCMHAGVSFLHVARAKQRVRRRLRSWANPACCLLLWTEAGGLIEFTVKDRQRIMMCSGFAFLYHKVHARKYASYCCYMLNFKVYVDADSWKRCVRSTCALHAQRQDRFADAMQRQHTQLRLTMSLSSALRVTLSETSCECALWWQHLQPPCSMGKCVAWCCSIRSADAQWCSSEVDTCG